MLRWVDGNYQTRTNHAFVDIPKECLQRLKKTEKYRTIGLSYGDKKKFMEMHTARVPSKYLTNKLIDTQTSYPFKLFIG